MSDFEQRRSQPRQAALDSARPASPLGSSSVEATSIFQSFPQKRIALQQLLRTLIEQRASTTGFRNPWAGMSEDQLAAYTDKVIDRLQKIRTQDLQVAQAIHLEAQAGNKPPQERLGDLKAALRQARERSGKLQGRAKARNRHYQKALGRDIEIHERLLENRAALRGDENVGESNISTMLLEAQERPGYARLYMTVFAPSPDDTRKDLQKNGAGRIEGRSAQLWLNIGSPARALSYVNAYRLQMNPDALPLVRSVLVPMAALEKFMSQSITEAPQEKAAIESWSKYDTERQINARQNKVSLTRAEPPVNTDTKYPNQFGLPTFAERVIVSTGAAGRSEQMLFDDLRERARAIHEEAKSTNHTRAAARRHDFEMVTSTVNPVYAELLNAADPESFVTHSHLEQFGARHEIEVDGQKRDFRSLASTIGLGAPTEPFVVNLLRGGEQPATVFSIRKDNTWKSPTNAELGMLVDDANDLFDHLDRLPDDRAVAGEAGPAAPAQWVQSLGDLLEANRLTPGALIARRGGSESGQRDRFGNSAVKAAFEDAFAAVYLESGIWRDDLATWSGSLAASIRDEVDADGREKLFRNAYVRQDMEALRRAAPGIGPWDPAEALTRFGELHDTVGPMHAQHVDLFFHLLRALGERKTTLKVDKFDTVRFGVNNRIKETALFDAINPPPGLRGAPVDPMRSTNRFLPNAHAKETALMRELDAPFLGGVSGTTRDYNNMLEAVFGAMNPQPFWRFQLLNTAFMVKHGYHSMFETLYPVTFYERTRGDVIQADYDALRRRGRSNGHIVFYRNALTAALGEPGEALWAAARDRARERMRRGQ